MKRTLRLLLILGLLAIANAQTDAETVLRAILDAQRGGTTQRATITMTVERPGRTSEYVIELVSDGIERSLIRVIAPAREAGQAFLQDGDNLFIYNPRLRRTLRLPPSGRSDAFLGSDISYDDLGGRDLERNYTAEVTAEDDETIELTLIPDELAPTPYGKVVLRADADDYRPLEYTFFDQREQAVRRIRFFDYVEVGELYFPTRLEVENLIRESERTVVVLSDFEFDIEIPSGCFTERALERGC
jgi:outer membrane lipoprotein-sorting protein